MSYLSANARLVGYVGQWLGDTPPYVTGVKIVALYVVTAIPIMALAFDQLGLAASDAGRWFFITWLTTGVFSIGLALWFRQPVSINLSIPALLVIGTTGTSLTLEEVLGASMLAGLISVILGVTGLTRLLIRIVPLPVALGMFSGTMLTILVNSIEVGAGSVLIAVSLVAVYFAVTLAYGQGLVSLATAAGVGLAVALATGEISPFAVTFEAPNVQLAALRITTESLVALLAPLVLLNSGVGILQGNAILKSNGYDPRVGSVAALAGLASVVNSVFGGHGSTMGGPSSALAADPATGPLRRRFIAIVVASVPTVALAFLAMPVIALVTALPNVLVVVLGALSLLPITLRSARKSLGGPNRLAATIAIGLTVANVSLFGIPGAVLALISGVAVVHIGHGLNRALRPAFQHGWSS